MAERVDVKAEKYDVKHRITKKDIVVGFRVPPEDYLKLIDIAGMADTSMSYLLRKALSLILSIGPDYFHFLHPICPSCGGYLSGIFAMSRLECIKCGRIYALEVVGDG